MAIERGAAEMMGDGLSVDESPEAEATEETASVQIPMSLIGSQKVAPGDVVRLEIVSVDDGNGVLNVKYAAPEAVPEEEKTIEGMAAAFD